ncbi:MAG TPA: hypothetical protein VK498_08665, partial [Ferruginibacter sp.]|nr:hypothetical protein [Ferruginibacter sp.]
RLLDDKKIRVITHSAGANVITSCLFNQTTKLSKDPEFFKNYIPLLNDPAYKTPVQSDIKIAIIAPAIPGYTTFTDYYNRNTENEGFKLKDNYNFLIGYNKKDPALNKYVGLSKYWGATTLGKSKKEVQKVFNLFSAKYKNSHIDSLDLTYYNAYKKQKVHAFRKYITNYRFDKVINYLYNTER